MADDELKTMLALLIDRFEAERMENAAFRAEVRQRFENLNERTARVEGRIEEQSKFLQLALASRQNRKPAA